MKGEFFGFVTGVIATGAVAIIGGSVYIQESVKPRAVEEWRAKNHLGEYELRKSDGSIVLTPRNIKRVDGCVDLPKNAKYVNFTIINYGSKITVVDTDGQNWDLMHQRFSPQFEARKEK